MIGGRTKSEIPLYLTGPHPSVAREQGFWGSKVPLPHGPPDGEKGLKANVEFLRKKKEECGPDFPLMVDCYMSLDVVGLGSGSLLHLSTGVPPRTPLLSPAPSLYLLSLPPNPLLLLCPKAPADPSRTRSNSSRRSRTPGSRSTGGKRSSTRTTLTATRSSPRPSRTSSLPRANTSIQSESRGLSPCFFLPDPPSTAHPRYGFRKLIEDRSIAILQPDVMWLGGLTELIKVAA